MVSFLCKNEVKYSIMTQSFESIIPLLQNSGVGVLPTDTLYGVVGLALNPQSVERIYTVKERNTNKPLIVLISDLSDLSQFGIDLTPQTSEMLNRYWPGPVSIILLCMDEQFTYLHRRTNSLAFRLPNNPQLIRPVRWLRRARIQRGNPQPKPLPKLNIILAIRSIFTLTVAHLIIHPQLYCNSMKKAKLSNYVKVD